MFGQIEAPAAIGIESDANRFDLPVGGETGVVAAEERMALAGERHIERARETHANGASCFVRAQRGDRCPRVGLHFLAAEGSAHAKAFDRHLIARNPQHACDDLLRLGGMLRSDSTAMPPLSSIHAMELCVSR